MMFLLPLLALSTGMPGSTVVIGLNGALQKRFILPSDSSLVPGNVHRASEVQSGIGGKGQDVAITLSCLSYSGNTKLAQFCGTDGAGETVFAMLEENLGRDGMELTVRCKSSMRTCTSIVSADSTTELVEPSGIISTAELDELMKKLEEKSSVIDALCVMGSMPPGCPENTYAEIYKRTVSSKLLCVVDSVVGCDSLLHEMREVEPSRRSSNVFKINASELCKLVGARKQGKEADGVEVEELRSALTAFVVKYRGSADKAFPLKGLAITDGCFPAYFARIRANEVDLIKLSVPSLTEKLLFPIGAGDSVAAGFLASWRALSYGQDLKVLPDVAYDSCRQFMSTRDSIKSLDQETKNLVGAFAFGLACGSASCLQEENSVVDIEDVLKLLASMDDPDFVESFTATQKAVSI